LKRISDQRHQGLQGLAELLDARALELVSIERRAALEVGQSNVSQLRAHLRQSHRKAGGLVLP
jgi:hypothetical protein